MTCYAVHFISKVYGFALIYRGAMGLYLWVLVCLWAPQPLWEEPRAAMVMFVCAHLWVCCHDAFMYVLTHELSYDVDVRFKMHSKVI